MKRSDGRREENELALDATGPLAKRRPCLGFLRFVTPHYANLGSTSPTTWAREASANHALPRNTLLSLVLESRIPTTSSDSQPTCSSPDLPSPSHSRVAARPVPRPVPKHLRNDRHQARDSQHATLLNTVAPTITTSTMRVSSVLYKCWQRLSNNLKHSTR